MKVLITGAGGFIGKELAEYLKTRHDVFGLDLKLAKTEHQISIDITDRAKVTSFFNRFRKKNRIDAIIHLASRLASADTTEDMDILYHNLKITEGVVAIAKILKPKKIINFSSIAVYPNKDGVYDEASEVRPSANSDCLYGISKLCSENILDFSLRKEGIVISHLRVSRVCGEGMGRDRIIPMMLKELREKNSITVFGEGERVDNFIDVKQLVKKVDLFLGRDMKGIYNIGQENLSYFDLAKRLIKDYGDGKSKIIKVKEGSRAKVYIDTTRIDKLSMYNSGDVRREKSIHYS